MAKDLTNLKWIEELLPEGYTRKHMFGGFAYYLNGKIILTMFESTGDRTYKDKTYNFDIWNGCMFPSERENHPAILKKFPYLLNHPVLPKWLYLPADSEDFDQLIEGPLRELRRHSPLFGSIPKPKKSKVSKEAKSVKSNPRQPQMFREPSDKKKTSNRTQSKTKKRTK